MGFTELIRGKGGPIKGLNDLILDLVDNVSEISGSVSTLNNRVLAVENKSVEIIGPRTGKGEEETVSHTLGATPSKVVVALASVPAEGGASATVGNKTATTVKVTVTASAEYYVILQK